MKKIKVTWVAMGHYGFQGDDIYNEEFRQERVEKLKVLGYSSQVDASAEFEADFNNSTDEEIAEMIYAQTNRYAGVVWDIMQPVMPANRPHTAISMGDLVEIDGRVYRCEAVGFKLVEFAG